MTDQPATAETERAVRLPLPPIAERLRLPAELLRGIGNLATGEAVNLALSLLSFVLITRLLSADGYGLWATVINAQTIAVGVAALGLPLATVQHIAARDGDRFVLPALLLRLLSAAVVGVVGLLLAFLPQTAARYGVPALCVVPGALASALVAGCEDVLRGRKQFRRAAALENVARVTLVLALVALALQLRRTGWHPPLAVVLGLWSLGWCAAAAVGSVLIAPIVRERTALIWQRALMTGRSARVLSAVTLVELLRFRLDVVLLGLLSSSTAAGSFAVSVRVFTVALVVPEVVTGALFPYLLHLRRREPEAPSVALGRVLFAVLAVGLAVSAALVLGAPLAVRVIAGSHFPNAAAPTRALAGLIAPAYLLSVLTIGLIERGRARWAAAALLAPLPPVYAFELALVHAHGQTVCLIGSGGAIAASCLLMAAGCVHHGVFRASLPDRPRAGARHGHHS